MAGSFNMLGCLNFWIISIKDIILLFCNKGLLHDFILGGRQDAVWHNTCATTYFQIPYTRHVAAKKVGSNRQTKEKMFFFFLKLEFDPCFLITGSVFVLCNKTSVKLLMSEHCFIFKFMVTPFITLNCRIFVRYQNVFTTGLFEKDLQKLLIIW
jgi:hypothetical protein